MEKQVDTISLGKLSNYAHFNYMDAVYKNLNSLLLMVRNWLQNCRFSKKNWTMKTMYWYNREKTT